MISRWSAALLLAFATSILGGVTARSAAAAAEQGPHRALVIGNSAYANFPPLPGCTASAHLVSAALKRAGFEVTERIDQSNGQMSGDLADLGRPASGPPDASIVVYICGYAMGFDNRVFLLPISAAIEHETDVLTEGIVAKSILDTVALSGAGAGLVLFDAVAKPSSASKLSFASLASAPPGGNVAMAAASTETAPPQGATPLATAVSAALTGPDIEVGPLLRVVQQRMPSNSGSELTLLTTPRALWLAGGPAPVAGATPAPVLAPAAPVHPSPAPASAPAAAPAPRPTAAFPEEPQMSDADRRQIQTALLKLGYYDGRVDGIFGSDTRAAIRRFQHEINAEMTGVITPPEASRLLAESH